MDVLAALAVAEAGEEIVEIAGEVVEIAAAAGEEVVEIAGEEVVEIAAAADPLHELQELARRRQPAEKVAWQRRDPRVLAYARSCKAAKRTATALENSRAEQAQLAVVMQDVRTHFPAVANAAGVVAKKVRSSTAGDGDAAPMTLERAAHMCRLAFTRGDSSAGFGIDPARLRAFASSLVLECQKHGLARLLWQCARFKAGSHQNSVVLVVSHEQDSTKQNIAMSVLQRVGRPSQRRLGVDVVFQSCMIYVSLATRDESVVVQEGWVCKPLVALGKTAAFVAKAVEMCKPFDLENESVLKAIAASTDAYVEDVRCDKGKNNLPAMRHLANLVETSCPHGLADASCCEVHVLHRIKTSAKDMSAMVGKMFALGNLLKLGGVVENLVENIQRVVNNDLRRVVMQPPTASTERWLAIMNELFDLTASHHQRASSRSAAAPSQMIQDIYSLLAVLNDEVGSDRWTHYCWDAAAKGPCCKDVEEAKEKTVVGLVYMFAVAAFPIVTMSRFTCVLKGLSKVIAGRACKNILARCMVVKRPTINQPELGVDNVGELGAGEGDFDHIKSTRLLTVQRWLSDPSTSWELPVAYVCLNALGKLEYLFMQPSDKEPFSARVLLDRWSSPIAACQGKLWRMLCTWHTRSDGPWRLLGLLGLVHSTDSIRQYTRGKLLVYSGGLAVHFEQKYASFPWKLCRLLSDQWSQEEREACLRDLHGLRDCCVSVFTRHFTRMFPTLELMKSKLAHQVLETWLTSKRCDTLTSERGHAGERAALSAASAPGQSFHHHARKEVLRQRRAVHMARHGVDPCAPPAKRAIANVRVAAPIACLADSSAPALGCGFDNALTWDAVAGASAPALEDQAAPQLAVQAVPVQGAQALVPATQTSRSGIGGSVLMTFINSRMAAAKKAKGASLSAAEIVEVRASAKLDMNGMTEEQKSAWVRQYRSQDARRQQGVLRTAAAPGSGELKVFKPHLGSGSVTSPLEPEHFVACLKARGGFPSNEEVYKPKAGFVIRPEDVRPDGGLTGAWGLENVLKTLTQCSGHT